MDFVFFKVIVEKFFLFYLVNIKGKRFNIVEDFSNGFFFWER